MEADAQDADNRRLIDEAERTAAAEPEHAFAAFEAAARSLAGKGRPAEEAECLVAAVAHGLSQGRPSLETLAPLNARSLAILDRGASPALAGQALLQRADIADRRGDLAGAAASLRDALPLLRSVDYPELLAMAEGLLGEVRRAEGNFQEAEAQYRAALAEWRRAGTPLAPASMLMKIARIKAAQGDPRAAGEMAEAALGELSSAPLAAPAGRLMTAACRELLGDCALALGDPEGARAHYQEADSRYRSLEQRDAAERVAAKLRAA